MTVDDEVRNLDNLGLLVMQNRHHAELFVVRDGAVWLRKTALIDPATPRSPRPNVQMPSHKHSHLHLQPMAYNRPYNPDELPR